MIALYCLHRADDEIVLLYAKHGGGGNLSMAERDTIRQTFWQDGNQQGAKT